MPKRREPSLAGGNVQKACPRGGGGFVQQGRSHFDARSVHEVREHGKMARTPLAAFFNIPIRGVCAILTPCRTGVSAPQKGKLFLREPLRICFIPSWDRIQVFGIHDPIVGPFTGSKIWIVVPVPTSLSIFI